jgi:hypothetical protein
VHGFAVGDEVQSLIDHKTVLSKGDKGKIIRASEGANSHTNVFVEFAHNGLQIHVIAGEHIEKTKRVNGFGVGDEVESLIDHESWLHKGDRAKIIGAGIETTSFSVLVEFATNGRRINVIAGVHIQKKANTNTATEALESRLTALSTKLEQATLQETSLISHTHGRQRRAERGIEKEELKRAIKFGSREKANPGRDGKTRWRYTHEGVVFITDEASKHEITSWRVDAAGGEVLQADIGGQGACRSHTVLIVDNSGSMRKDDVQGHNTRTAAVYDCLEHQFVIPQIEAIKSSAKGALDAVATLITMSDEAEVVFERQPFDQAMVNTMQHLKNSRAHSHGNYLPALDKAIEVLEADAFSGAQLFLVFLSDGAPSDHCQMCCQHGVQVWQDNCDGERQKNGRFPFLVCEDPRTAQTCRGEVRASVKGKCLDRISRLGDLFGRDRTYVGTVAFGPESEDYQVLKDMAAKLPRGTFQRLGLSAMSLKTAFSSLTSDLTTLNTQMSGKSLTVRNV